MIVRMFQKRFAALVESGAKKQTIRPTPKRMPKVGEAISLRVWCGKPYRSKQRVLKEATITNVSEVLITHGGIELNGLTLFEGDARRFARADGFQSEREMIEWFKETHGLPFFGVLLVWK